MALHQIGLVGGWPAAVVVIRGGAPSRRRPRWRPRARSRVRRWLAAAPCLVFAPAAVSIGDLGRRLLHGPRGGRRGAVRGRRQPGAGRLDRRRRTGRRARARRVAVHDLRGRAAGSDRAGDRGVPPRLARAGARRRGVVAVFLAFYARGFSWFDGLRPARELQLAGVFEHRPYRSSLLVASPAAFALVVGPAVAVGLARLRRHGAWVLCGAALAGLLLADLSGTPAAETERVWLPFAPWLLLAAGAASRTCAAAGVAGGSGDRGAYPPGDGEGPLVTGMASRTPHPSCTASARRGVSVASLRLASRSADRGGDQRARRSSSPHSASPSPRSGRAALVPLALRPGWLVISVVGLCGLRVLPARAAEAVGRR